MACNERRNLLRLQHVDVVAAFQPEEASVGPGANHLHQIRLMTMPDIRFMELAVGPGRLVFPGYEVTGNLWLVRPD